MRSQIGKIELASNDKTVAYVAFEKLGTSDQFEEDTGTTESDKTRVIERYVNGEFVGFCKLNQTDSEDTNSNASTVSFEIGESEFLNLQESVCRWIIGFEPTACQIKPISSAVVKIACPGSMNGKCDALEPRMWICDKCEKYLEYDFDENFVCGCGSGPVTNVSFKCDSKTHTGNYYVFNRNDCFERLESLKRRDELNILILGETGVGKSTFINAFANYLTFSTMDEAEVSDLICLIPCSYSMTDKDYQVKTVQFGHDRNEVEELGASKTQSCKCYSFPSENRLIRIIDTPGVGDTRGVQYDRRNFEDVLSFVSNYSSIHGIVMLLKPNESRLSAYFRYIVQDLLSHLHKNASENIVFVFTHARATLYRPGGTLPLLTKQLDEIRQNEPYVDIPLNRGKIYCLDNEAFRFILALKSDDQYRGDKTNFEASWEKSVVECERLLNYIAGLRPHLVEETITLNEAKRLIMTLSKPLADITECIQLNLGLIQDQKKEIQKAGDNVDQLRKVLHEQSVDYEPIQLYFPKTVCTTPACVTHRKMGIKSIVDYTTVCHSHCYLSNVTPDIINNQQLKYCAAMNLTNNCQICHCHYEKHMHVRYERQAVYKSVVNATVHEQILHKESRQLVVRTFLRNLEYKIKKLDSEQKYIIKSSAKFVIFLKKNCIKTYNDALNDYLAYLITVEEQKNDIDGERNVRIMELKNLQRQFEEEIRILTINDGEAVLEIPQTITIKDIEDTVKLLYQLELNGDNIRKMMRLSERSRATEQASYSERVYQSPSSRNTFKGLGRDSNALQKLMK